jgi:disulfide bond formation protein DsbB
MIPIPHETNRFSGPNSSKASQNTPIGRFFKTFFVSHRRVALLVALGALAALGVAYWAQDILLLVPCPLCLWERWPYRVVIALGILAALLRPASGRFVLGLAALALLAAAALGLLHTGVEFHWWKSPLPECNGILRPGAPLPMIPAKPCDEPTFLIPPLPVSMAAMNFIYATAFAFSLLAYLSRKPRRFR